MASDPVQPPSDEPRWRLDREQPRRPLVSAMPLQQFRNALACRGRDRAGAACSRCEGHEGPCASWAGRECDGAWAGSRCELAAGHEGWHAMRTLDQRGRWLSLEWA